MVAVYWMPDGSNGYSVKRIMGYSENNSQLIKSATKHIESIHETYTKGIPTEQMLGTTWLMESIKRRTESEHCVLSVLTQKN